MRRPTKALPFVPTEIHVSTVEDDKGLLGILSIQTTQGILELRPLTVQPQTPSPSAVEEIRSKPGTSKPKRKARFMGPGSADGFLGTPNLGGSRPFGYPICITIMMAS